MFQTPASDFKCPFYLLVEIINAIGKFDILGGERNGLLKTGQTLIKGDEKIHRDGVPWKLWRQQYREGGCTCVREKQKH